MKNFFLFIILSSLVCVSAFGDPESIKTLRKGDIIIQGGFTPAKESMNFAEMVSILEILSKQFDIENEGVIINIDIFTYTWDQIHYKTAKHTVRISPNNVPLSILTYALASSFLGIPIEIVESVSGNGQHILTIKEIEINTKNTNSTTTNTKPTCSNRNSKCGNKRIIYRYIGPK